MLASHPDTQHYSVYDKYGLTPLHYAVIFNNKVAAETLIPFYSRMGTSTACRSYK